MRDEVDERVVDPAGPLDTRERRQLDVIRRFGTIGALLLAVGSLGAGAAPVFNPVWRLPVLGMFSRMTTVSLTIAFTGVFMIVLAWLALGRLSLPGRARMVSLPQMGRTLAMWTTPLVFTVPMFSKDVYSYLAQSEIAARGLDPYTVGPAEGLGIDDDLTRGVPTMWRETPSPYGPLFLTVGKAINWITGNHVVMGVAFHRLLALVGFAMIVWALPRLARRFGINPVSALWLGAANPLVLFHLVVGIHNESLAIGLMLVGVELALRGMPRTRPGGPFPPWQSGELLWYGIGAAVITLGAAVKIPAALALGFLGVMIARRLGGRWKHVLGVAGGLAVVFLSVLTITSLGSGLGYGWVSTLNTASAVKSWMAPMTALGFGAGGLGILLGLGNHIDAAITVSRMVGTLLGPLLAAKLLLDSLRWRLRPMIGLGAALGAVLVFGATVQPWYLLWAALPLAVAAGDIRFRTMATAISAGFAVALPPTGSTFDGRAYQLPYAYAGAVIVVALALFVVRRHIPTNLRRRPETVGVAG
ncbi:polyprenol phosphomannose-dependent alpha 1,6 mannosyltransferase MptB [Actinophytocola gossypii]|uniref:Polyprenol phosphomannose-dependent alpha 1,6 mannosyltransferase MptB n=1 Tax=Actinophytocola gossypii TaxID=2812003 RepID=A0ABT2J608_9PSEU|nr:polyprenol phosphomannose-dependent alpha 1,6 mannosyltransferase MptB [Actinophytocola gossypii]MCT2583297.1 polyprenol phosphomannose-dependent alpha 1,6 mannosyltransferase MptB [Actinophytocola gossypii]